MADEGQGVSVVGTTPRPLVAVGMLFIVVGTIGFGYHVREIDFHQPFANDAVWVCVVRLVAVIGGVFLLRRRRWAGWLIVAWMAYHVVLSAFHSALEVLIHAVILAVLALLLWRARASLA